MSKTVSTFRRVWAAPVAIALASLTGLVSALLGDGLNDWLSWIGLAIPVLVIGWARVRRRA